jgi:hypothetical protein
MRRNKKRGGAVSLPVVVTVWLTIAVVIGATGSLARLPVPPPAIAIAFTAILLLLVGFSAPARERVRQLGIAPLVAFHWVRIAAGAYFLWLSSLGMLPAEFAQLAGWGDIAVGVAALIVFFLCLPVRTTTQRNALLLWNAFGLLDILLVLGNGVRIFLRDPAVAVPFTALPLALLPLFVVPIVIVSHVLLFAWIRRQNG